MVGYFEIRHICHSISFFSARLRVFLVSLSGHRPHIGLFVSRDSAFRLVLTNLYPLLHHSLNWYHLLCEMSGVEREGSMVRSSELETGLSSNDKPMEVEVDTDASRPSFLKPDSLKASSSSKARAFHALEEKCNLDEESLFSFRDRFHFPNETRICLTRQDEKACFFTHGEVCFYKATFFSGLKFLVHPFIMDLLHHLNIALGQLMSNLWRIVIRLMEIWLIVLDGDMIRLDEFIHLYRLKKVQRVWVL